MGERHTLEELVEVTPDEELLTLLVDRTHAERVAIKMGFQYVQRAEFYWDAATQTFEAIVEAVYPPDCLMHGTVTRETMRRLIVEAEGGI